MGNRRFEHRAGIRRTWAAMAVGLALLAGCAIPSWPWGSHDSSPAKPISNQSQASSPASPKSSANPADAQSLQQVMNELRDVMALDPAAQAKLMADLKQVDPSLQPMVLQTFLAEAAYKRREEQREAEQQKQESTNSVAPRDGAATKSTVAGEQGTRSEPKSPAGQPSSGSSPTAGEEEPAAAVAPQPSSLSTGSVHNRPALSPEPRITGGIDSGSTTAATAVGKVSEASLDFGGLKLTLHQPAGEAGAAPAEPPSTADPPSTAARLAATRREAFNAGAAPLGDTDWQRHLTETIRSIELESKAGSKNESDIALQARLRMLYLLAGRRDDAMRPLPAAPQAAQDYWSSQIYGLSTWMDAEKTPDSGQRAAETKWFLTKAMAQLGETAPLAVRNVTFCTEVSRFGSFDAVKSREFTPGKKVLLYAEVDNLHIESSAKGYHWAVKITGQILDDRNNPMTDLGSASCEEYYQTPRHDFFVTRFYYLPNLLLPGRYNLQLTIEDTLGHKVGRSQVDFMVKLQ